MSDLDLEDVPLRSDDDDDVIVEVGTPSRVREISYVLAMLSHGYPYSATAEETLTSFSRAIDIPPAYAIYYHDGPGAAFAAAGASEYESVSSGSQEGFCVATRKLWQRAARVAVDRAVPYVFWLEHDFRFLRPFRVRDLAAALIDARTCQVSLMRQPINYDERTRGRVLPLDSFVAETGYVVHDRYFTTNPSMMRAAFMRECPFPDERECEGKFGLSLRDDGRTFAVLGDGDEQYVEHFGHRSGHGY